MPNNVKRLSITSALSRPGAGRGPCRNRVLSWKSIPILFDSLGMAVYFCIMFAHEIIRSRALFPRDLAERIRPWLDRPEAVLVEGCRRVGKTSLLILLARERLKSGKPVLFLDLEDPDDLDVADGGPVDLKRILGGPGTVFIDEIHHLDNPARFIKLAVDHHPELKLICTGSSSLRFHLKQSDSLIGRVVGFELWPLGFREFLSFRQERTRSLLPPRPVFDLSDGSPDHSEKKPPRITARLARLFEEYVVFGGFPEVALAENKEVRWKLLGQMFRVYALRDLKDLFEVRQEAVFRRFFTALASTVGGQFKQTELASEIGVSNKTARRYLEILETLYLVRSIRPFLRNPRSEVRKLPKVYFTDTGLLAWTAGWRAGLDRPSDAGRLVENTICTALARNLSEGQQLHFWRKRSGPEVDFVVSAGEQVLPVEVKWRASPSMPSGLRSFVSSYSPSRGYIVTRDTYARRKIDGTPIISVPAAAMAG